MSLESCHLKFSGHQTFPVRYGWIFKIIKEIKAQKSINSSLNIEEQMISMGMGKNMVLSVRHWVKVLNLIKPSNQDRIEYELNDVAVLLFGQDINDEGKDLYLDKIGSIWLLHWLSQSIAQYKAELNTARWFFNYFNGYQFDKAQLSKDITLSLANHKKEITEATLKKDIDCFIQTYSHKYATGISVTEDSFLSPFSELGLIVQKDNKHYISELSSRKSLPIQVFTYALVDYFQRKQKNHKGSIISTENTLSFDSLLNDVGSPGRIFRLTSSGLSEKLDEVERFTKGEVAWIDTMGLRQIQHNFKELHKVNPVNFLKSYYK